TNGNRKWQTRKWHNHLRNKTRNKRENGKTRNKRESQSHLRNKKTKKQNHLTAENGIHTIIYQRVDSTLPQVTIS
ncbi:hypothetical protein M569_06707, partial [Genlisea aurea]